jgi:hypothetical protein
MEPEFPDDAEGTDSVRIALCELALEGLVTLTPEGANGAGLKDTAT